MRSLDDLPKGAKRKEESGKKVGRKRKGMEGEWKGLRGGGVEKETVSKEHCRGT